MPLATNRVSVLTAIVLMGGFATTLHAATPTPLPAEAGFLSTALKLSRPVAYEPWNQLPFPQDTGKPQGGKHWAIYAASAPGAPDKVAAWTNTVKPAFLAHGWKLVTETRTQPLYGTFHYTQNGVEAWANIGIGNPNEVGVEVIEIAPLPYTLTFPPPQATA